jgi:hypothetical protein
MLKLYKKVIPLIGIAQLILFGLILVFGFFSYNIRSRFLNYDYYSYFYTYNFTIIATLYQLVFYSSMISPWKLLHQNKLKNVKLFAILSSVFYVPLITLYIIVGEEWIFGGYFYDYTSPVGYVLGVFWIISYLLFFIPFLSSLVVSFIAPRNKSEAQLQQQKSKNSNEASIKIRDLKKLLDEGIISKEIFDEKSKKYIEEL